MSANSPNSASGGRRLDHATGHTSARPAIDRRGFGEHAAAVTAGPRPRARRFGAMQVLVGPPLQPALPPPPQPLTSFVGRAPLAAEVVALLRRSGSTPSGYPAVRLL